MNWQPALSAIRIAVSRAAGLRDVAVPGTTRTLQRVSWRATRAGARTGSGPWVDLRIDGIVGVGRDETRYDEEVYAPTDPGYDPLDPTATRIVAKKCGQRRFRVQCYCRSESQEPHQTAQMVAETIRSGIVLPSIATYLSAAGVGFSHVQLTGTYDYVDADKRVVSEAIVDLVLLLGVTTRDDLPEASSDWVGHVEGSGDLETGFNGVDITPDIVVHGPSDPDLAP